MTGRYPFHYGFYNNQDANNYGVPLNFTFLPQALKNGGNYRTHAIGKVRHYIHSIMTIGPAL